jgi:hypothetical protein
VEKPMFALNGAASSANAKPGAAQAASIKGGNSLFFIVHPFSSGERANNIRMFFPADCVPDLIPFYLQWTAAMPQRNKGGRRMILVRAGRSLHPSGAADGRITCYTSRRINHGRMSHDRQEFF